MQPIRTSTRTAAALLLTSATALAQAAEIKYPRPLPDAGDAKTVAAPIVKTVESTVREARAAEAPKTKGAPPTSPVPFAAAHSRMYYQDTGDATWARGATYKARFAHDGVELVPLFGASAPRNMPLELELAGVTIAGDALPFDGSVDAARTGDVLEFDRGSVVERYSASPEALEQSFVFASLPQRGELALQVAFGGEYTVLDDGRALEFANELGNVVCRDAVAFDAGGRRLELPLVVHGSSYSIVVPADFVQSAALPLVVDPTFVVLPLDTSPDDDYLADAAYESLTATWRFVYEEAVSQTDTDVYSFAMDANGIVLTNSGNYVDMTSERWAHPRIASNRVSASFAVVAEAGPVGGRVIKSRHISGTTYGFSGVSTVASSFGMEVFHPDIGGDPASSAPTYFLVTFERVYAANDHDIMGWLLDSSGAPIGGMLTVDASAYTIDEAPSISKSNGVAPAGSQEWTIVWQRLSQVGDHDIYGARVHWDGWSNGGPFLVAASNLDETHPSISSPLDVGNPSCNSLMACEVAMTAYEHDIKIALLSGGAVLDTENLSAWEPYPLDDQIRPRVDSDGSQFIVGYAESWALGLPDYDVFAAFVGAPGNSLALVTTRAMLTSQASPEHNACIVAVHSGGAASTRYCAAWDEDVGTDRNIMGALIDGPPARTIWSFCDNPAVICPCGNNGAPGNGCANSANALGARLETSGAPSVAHDTLAFQASGMPTTASCVIFEGTSPMNAVGVPFGDGRKCVGGTIVRFPLKSCVNGATSYPQSGDASVSAAGHVPVAGGTRYYQAWYRDPASFCSSSTFNLSNALSIDWLP